MFLLQILIYISGGRGKEHRRDSGIASPRTPRDVEIQVTPIPSPVHNGSDGKDDATSSGTPESIESSGSDVTETTEDDLEELNRRTHLPRDHPARKLLPIDLMFLVDTSSSIGINNFDIVGLSTLKSGLQFKFSAKELHL